MDYLSETKFTKNVIHSFSPFDITEEEIQAFSYGLDQHIPLHLDRYIF